MNNSIGSSALRGSAPSSMRKYLGLAPLVALLAVNACGDMTGPSEAPDAQTVVANGPALGGLISGESARLIPSVTNNAGRDELSASLDQLTAALEAGLGNESRAAIARFNTAMSQYVTSIDNPDVAAELSALQHAVQVVREAVEGTGT